MLKPISSNLYTVLKTVLRYVPLFKVSKAPIIKAAELSNSKIASHYKTSTPPAAIPLTEIIKRLPNMFPLSLKDSQKDYAQFCKYSKKFQTDLFSSLQFFPLPSDNIQSKFVETNVGDNDFINEFCVEPVMKNENSPLKHLIIIHGYGAGLGFFVKNIEHFAKTMVEENWCIHAIDLPGYGYSTRNKFPFDVKNNSHEQVESWFHTKINQWFEKRGLLKDPDQNMVLAHSMGAYLMASYASNQNLNHHWKKLVMCSPGGITPTRTPPNPPSWFVKLWDRNISPFSIVRNLGSLGSKVTSGWSFRRFSNLGDSELKLLLHRYTYGIFNRKGSGEYMLPFFLKCGGDPRYPLQERLFTEKIHSDKSPLTNPKMEWVWVYGDRDWMNIDGGFKCSKFLTDHSVKSTVIEVPDSGHHLYLDNLVKFNELIVKEMKNM